jgi:hypothetical protein
MVNSVVDRLDELAKECYPAVPEVGTEVQLRLHGADVGLKRKWQERMRYSESKSNVYFLIWLYRRSHLPFFLY